MLLFCSIDCESVPGKCLRFLQEPLSHSTDYHQHCVSPGPFNFKKLLDFTSFFKEPVRLGNRTYRAWGVKIRSKNGQLNGPVRKSRVIQLYDLDLGFALYR